MNAPELRRPTLALSAALLLAAVGVPASRAGSLHGEIARSDFHSWATNHGGVFLNFNALLAGTQILNQWESRYGVTFATTAGPDGRPLPAGVPVMASASYAYNVGKITIVGTRPRPAYDDKSCSYEVRFVRPQRWAGLQRYWKGPTLTRFLDVKGEILHEFEGEGFVGWFAETADPATWVSRIEITGQERNGARQVGYSDDVIFGTNAIPRALPYLSLRSGNLPVLAPAAAPRFQLDYQARRNGGSNEWLLATNAVPLGTNAPAPASRDLLIDLN